MLPDRDPPTPEPEPAPAAAVADVYDRHAPFVWRVLRGLGVPDASIDDAVQDVFVVVHRRLGEFEGRSELTSWLFGICRRVASTYRRRAGRAIATAEEPAGAESPHDHAERREAAALVLEALAALDPDRREVFVLVELEQLTAPAVAELLGIPLNTVYSRLRVARQRFEAALARRVKPEGAP